MLNLNLFWIFNIFIVVLFVIGLYYIIVTRNLIRVLIGIEILIKAITLLIIIAGYVNNHIAQAQAIVLTLIIIEVFFVAIAAGIILNIYRRNNSLDTHDIRNLKG